MLHIVLVADGDPWSRSTNSGVALGLATALSERDDVKVVGGIDSRPTGVFKFVLQLVSFRPSKDAWQNEYRKGSLSTLLRSAKRDLALRRIQKASRVDLVVHIRNTYRPTRLPFVNFLDNTASLSQDGWPSWRLGDRSFRARTRAERRQFDRALAVYTAADHVAVDVKERYGQPESKVRAIGGGTNFTLSDVEQSANVTRPFSVLFVGRDFERKGGFVLAEAFASMHAEDPDCTLTIVGPRAIPDSIADMPGVNFRGPVADRGILSALYSSSDVFCLPALYEPYGLVIQEALAHGTPCIVSNVGALYELTGYGRGGSSVSAGDASELHKTLREYMLDRSLLAQKRAGTREVLTGMTWERVAERMIDHLHNLARTVS